MGQLVASICMWVIAIAGGLDAILLLAAAVLWTITWFVQYRCGKQGHTTEHRVVISGICFEIVCTKCGKQVYAGPYDPDPDIF